MDKTFGEFLKQKRQEKNLTQKELAELLFVTNTAVSKWEKDVAHPDITLLPKLSQILGVTEHELITASVDKQTREEKKQAKKWRALTFTWSLFFYISYAIALIPCFICNLAIDKTLSWFWIVLSALLLAFTFTNLPKLIKKNKLLFLPLGQYLALCLLLGVCCLYTNGNWFILPVLSVLLGLSIIFVPIYLCKYKIFAKVKKYADFISVAVVFVLLNILLIVCDIYSVVNDYVLNHWYFYIALPICLVCYLILNLLISVRFLKVNKLLKTSVILYLISVLQCVTPLIIKPKRENLKEELEQLNIFKADFSCWIPEVNLDNNISCIVCLSLLLLATIFLIVGIIRHFVLKKRKNKTLN